MIKLILYIIVLLCIYAPVFADITGTTGTIAEGLTVNITGEAFGVKSPAAPYFWDNLEGGVNGEFLDGESGTIGTPTWENYGLPTLPEYNNSESYGVGSMSAYKASDGNDFGTVGIDGLSSTVAFFSCKWRWTASGINWETAVIKPFRLTSTGGYYTNTPRFRIQSQPHVPNLYDNYENCTSCGTTDQEYAAAPSQSEWHSFDTEIVIGTVNVANGTFKTWHDSVINFDDTAAVTLATGYTNADIDSILAPGELANNNAQNYTVRFDNFYFDNTLSRIVLGNNTVFTSCTHTEIQIPSAWNANGEAITFTVNQGTFEVDETAYLFVIDSTGTPSAGYEVTIGAAAPTGVASTGMGYSGITKN